MGDGCKPKFLQYFTQEVKDELAKGNTKSAYHTFLGNMPLENRLKPYMMALQTPFDFDDDLSHVVNETLDHFAYAKPQNENDAAALIATYVLCLQQIDRLPTRESTQHRTRVRKMKQHNQYMLIAQKYVNDEKKEFTFSELTTDDKKMLRLGARLKTEGEKN